MRALIITVAGMSSRFSDSLGRACLKCLYYEKDYKESLLYRMICRNVEFDLYIIVGGFRYGELERFMNEHFGEMRNRILLLENKAYQKYGSGYSLYIGLKEAVDREFDEVVFAEGDLYVDDAGFQRVCDAKSNVITYNRESILAKKAVAFYYDEQYGIHYIYDMSHSSLEIREPFLGIFNSGQIWKFSEKDRMAYVFYSLAQSDWFDTNLVFVQKYFDGLTGKDYEMVSFDTWINCNTISDFRKIKE